MFSTLPPLEAVVQQKQSSFQLSHLLQNALERFRPQQNPWPYEPIPSGEPELEPLPPLPLPPVPPPESYYLAGVTTPVAPLEPGTPSPHRVVFILFFLLLLLVVIAVVVLILLDVFGVVNVLAWFGLTSTARKGVATSSSTAGTTPPPTSSSGVNLPPPHSPSSSSTGPTQVVSPGTCQSTTSNPTATPLWAMPFTADASDIVSGTTLNSSPLPSVVSVQSFGTRGPSLLINGGSVPLKKNVVSSSAFSYCLWVYIAGYPNLQFPTMILGAGGTDAGTLCIGINQNGVFFLGRGVQACQCQAGHCTANAVYNAPLWVAAGAYDVLPGNQNYWTHLCVTYGAQTAVIYINGTQASTTPVNVDTALAGEQLIIGPSLQDLSDPFVGGQQCISAWEVALTAGQVYSMWYNQMAGGSACQTLISYTNFSCVAPTIPTYTPVFLTGATTLTPLPSIALPTRNPASFGRTFYVSQLFGSDSNNGLSPSTPWQTLTMVNGLTSSGYPVSPPNVLPGDTFLLCNGDSYWFPIGILFNYGSEQFGSATAPITIANWTCRPDGTTKRPFLSQSVILPQTTGVSGWTTTSWTFANGTTSTTSVLAYNVAQLTSAAGGTAFIPSNPGIKGAPIWINGTEYITAVHPNWIDPLVRIGQALQEFVWYDGFYAANVPFSTPTYSLQGGSYCASFFYGLYGGNQALFQAGAGGTTGYYADGVTAYLSHVNTYQSPTNLITAWSPAQYTCAEWYNEYVTKTGYPFPATVPWVYSIPMAQNTSDPHWTTPLWQPTLLTPNAISAGQLAIFPWTDEFGLVREWTCGAKFTGHREFLDAPGECWYDSTNQILYCIPLPGHRALMLASFTTTQVPFTLIAQGNALFDLGLNSAPTVILTGFQGQGGIGSQGGGSNSGYYSIHDIEIGYSTNGLSIAPANIDVYNMDIHDIVGFAIYFSGLSGSDASNTWMVYNNKMTNIMNGVGTKPTTAGSNIYVYNNSFTGMALTFGDLGDGIGVTGTQTVVVRGNSLANMGGNSACFTAIATSKPADVAEFNVATNGSLLYFDCGFYLASGTYRFNQAYNSATQQMAGFFGPDATSNSDAVYASSGADGGTWSYNLFANITGNCFFAALFPGNTFTNNLCIDNSGNDDAPGPGYQEIPGNVGTYWNNWVMYTKPNWSMAEFPYQEPYFPQRTEYFHIGRYWTPGGAPATHSVLHWTQSPSFPLYNRSLYCNALLEGKAGGTFTLAADVAQTYGNNAALLEVMSNTAWATENDWAFTTDQYNAGLQYGQDNCRQIRDNAVLDLLSYSSVVRAATEQTAWNTAFAGLGWYS